MKFPPKYHRYTFWGFVKVHEGQGFLDHFRGNYNHIIMSILSSREPLKFKR